MHGRPLYTMETSPNILTAIYITAFKRRKQDFSLQSSIPSVSNAQIINPNISETKSFFNEWEPLLSYRIVVFILQHFTFICSHFKLLHLEEIHLCCHILYIWSLNSSTLTYTKLVSLFLTGDCWITDMIFSSHCTTLLNFWFMITSGFLSVFLSPSLSFPTFWKVKTWHKHTSKCLSKSKHITQMMLCMIYRPSCVNSPSPLPLSCFFAQVSLLFDLSGLQDKARAGVRVYVFKPQPLQLHKGRESWNRGHAAIFQGQRGSLCVDQQWVCHKSVNLSPVPSPGSRCTLSFHFPLLTLSLSLSFSSCEPVRLT